MFYRDGLNGIFIFGGIYMAGVLGWDVVNVGLFGIIAVAAAVVFTWLGGRADGRFGPKPVIVTALLVLTAISATMVFVSRDAVFGVALAPGSRLPDILFYGLGAALGAAGGVIQTASRTMMCHQAPEERMTQAFGLYALAGKATSFIAPLSIAVVTGLTDSQTWGITPLIVLFLLGLLLLSWVRPEGDRPR